jgi:hypothetical protein
MNDIGVSGGVLRARGLRRNYGSLAGLVHAVNGVDLEVARGETPVRSRHQQGIDAVAGSTAGRCRQRTLTTWPCP